MYSETCFHGKLYRFFNFSTILETKQNQPIHVKISAKVQWKYCLWTKSNLLFPYQMSTPFSRDFLPSQNLLEETLHIKVSTRQNSFWFLVILVLTFFFSFFGWEIHNYTRISHSLPSFNSFYYYLTYQLSKCSNN